MDVFANAIAAFLVAFPALFSIVNPIGGALIYSQITAGRPQPERVRLAWRVATYSTAVMLTALWAGAAIMSFFGISIEALRIAGGLVVAVQAWKMLSAPEETEGRKEEQAEPARDQDDVAFFPLTLPFTTGPGTIAVSIALSASRPDTAVELVPFFLGVSVAALVIAALVGAFYSTADRIVAAVGRSQARVLTRLSAFLLLCIGVQISVTGAQGALAAVFRAAAGP